MIGARRISASTAWIAAAIPLAVIAAAPAAAAAGADEDTVTWLVAAIAVGAPLAYIIWHADPAYTLTAGLLLSPFSGNWEGIGIPGQLAPDRLLLLAGVAAVILRAPGIRERPKLRIEAAHWVLGAAVLYATFSAVASDTLVEREGFFRLFQAFGILPLLVFLVAPVVFRTRRQRLMLLSAFVVLGGYLGLTALFEAVGLRALVFPSYILDPQFGIHAGRGRGPFVEAVTNGVALYVCAVAAGVALMSWETRGARMIAASVAGLCLLGAFLTLQRSVWLGGVVATLAAVVMLPEGRRMFARIVPALLIGLVLALAAIPSLGAQVNARFGNEQTVWDRRNTNRAALNMVEARPIFGFGWSRYTEQNADYFQASPDYPLSGGTADLHNLFLTYAVELGLLGLGLWAIGLGLVVAGALRVRGPPDLLLWRAAFVPITIFLIVVVNFVPPSAFPTLALSLWAGVVWSGRYPEQPHRGVRGP